MSQSTFWKQSLLVAIGAACFTLTTENIKPAAAASFTAVDFSAPTTNLPNGAWSLGFQFTTEKTVNVTALGFYDDLQDGLTQSHEVGIFDDIGTLLVKGIVEPSNKLDGFFAIRMSNQPCYKLVAHSLLRLLLALRIIRSTQLSFR